MNFSEILIYIVLIMTLLVATICERIFFNISPFIWLAGGVLSIVFGIMNLGIIPIYEALLAFVIVMILTIVLFSKLQNGIGGGILKGFIMCSLFFGRYVVITFVIFIFCCFIVERIKFSKLKEYLPGEKMIAAMPILDIAVIMTLICIYVINTLLIM